MLRLAASQIGLNSKDLEWHKNRHNARQALRNDGHTVERIGSPVRSCPETPDNLKLALPYYFPCPPFDEKRIRHNDEDEDDELLFDGPALQGSGAFWDRVMANAGKPLGIQLQHVDRRPRIIEKSRASPDISRSLKGSIEHVLNGDLGISEAHDFLCSSQYSPKSSADIERSAQLQLHFSTKCPSSSSIGLDKEETLSSNSSAEQLLASHVANLFTLPPFHRQDLAGTQRRYRNGTPWQISGSRELDGSSDPGQNHHKIQEQRVKDQLDSQQVGYRPREDSAKKAVSNGPIRLPRLEDSIATTSSPSQDPYKLAMSPQLPVSRIVEAMRRRSNGLQRSSLHISHVAPSSSPEKYPRASPNPSIETTAQPASSLEDQSLPEQNYSHAFSGAPAVFSLAIRRGRNNRISSRSISWNSQEVFQHPGSHRETASLNERIARGRSVASLAPPTARSDSHASFTSSPPHSLTPSPASTPRRSLNPNAIPFTPNNTPPAPSPRRLFPSSNLSVPPPASLPLYPFSATPRSVSFSASTASPSPFTRPSPHSHPHLFSSPPSPYPPHHLTVYNDGLPAFSQPQTPAQLTRNPYSTMSSLRAFGAGITQTAPVGDNRGSWPRPSVVALTPTPTRRSRYDYQRLEDQENITADAELERRRLRDIEARRRREPRGGAGAAAGGGRDRAGGGGDGLLATTPE